MLQSYVAEHWREWDPYVSHWHMCKKHNFTARQNWRLPLLYCSNAPCTNLFWSFCRTGIWHNRNDILYWSKSSWSTFSCAHAPECGSKNESHSIQVEEQPWMENTLCPRVDISWTLFSCRQAAFDIDAAEGMDTNSFLKLFLLELILFQVLFVKLHILTMHESCIKTQLQSTVCRCFHNHKEQTKSPTRSSRQQWTALKPKKRLKHANKHASDCLVRDVGSSKN